MSNTRIKIEEQIAKRAMADSDYKEELTKDPKKMLESSLGIKLPENMNVHVHEETQNDIHIVIPHHGQDGRQSEELSAEELEGVSGGWLPAPIKY